MCVFNRSKEFFKLCFSTLGFALRYKNGISSLPKFTMETIWTNFKFTALFKPVRELRLKIGGHSGLQEKG